MRAIIGNVWQPFIDAGTLTYTHTTADPVSTCSLDLVDNTSSITVSKMQEVLILDEKVYPNPTVNLLQNPTFNPYNSIWTVNSYTGISEVQINQSTANLTLYLSTASSTVYGGNADQLYSNAGTPTTASFATVIGNNVTGFGEIVNRTGTPPYSWAASSSLPSAPTGRGWLFDLGTFLQGGTLQSGAYTPTFRFQATQGGAGAGTLKGDFTCRLWKWNSASTAFSLIATSTLTNQTITSTAASLTFQQGYGANTAFDVGDYLYLDIWFNCKTNTNGASNQAITLSNLSTDTVGHTGDVNAQLVTPGNIIPAAVALNINTASVGTAYVLQQTVLAGQIVPGQSYMLSGYFAWGSPDPNVGGLVQIDWYDASKTFISNAFYFGPKPGLTAFTRYSVQSVAPANAAYGQASFGISIANATNSATVTISNVQFEPVWFTDYTYPLPFAGPNQPNCQHMGNSNLWIRQYRKFGGWVQHAQYYKYVGNVRRVKVNAVGFAALLGEINVNDSFSNAYDSSIFASLLSTYTGSLYDTSQIIQGVLVSNLNGNWDDIRTIADALAAQAANFWTVNAYYQVLYQPPGYTTMPFQLVCDNSLPIDQVFTFPAFSFEREMDYTQPGSNILVIGGTPASTSLTAALTSGTHYTSLSVVALTQALPANMVCSLSGQQGITLSADAAVGATTLNIFSFLALNNYAVGSAITPQPLVSKVLDPAAIQGVISGSLYGQGLLTSLLMRKVNDSALQSISDCNQRGIAELLQYDYERYIYHLTTNVELIAGQGVPVTSNTDGLSATTLLIQQVVATWMGVDETMTDTWEYAADLGAVNRAASQIMSHIFRSTNTNTSAPAIIQTSLFASERIGLQDSPPLAYAQLVLANAPFGYWRLGETSGITAYDSTLNGGNGTYHGGYTQGQPGLIYLDPNAAVLLDGSTGYVTTATSANLYISTAMHVLAWFTLSTQSFGGCTLVGDSNSNISNQGFQVLLKTNGAGFEFDIGGVGGLSVVSTGAALTAGVRYLLSCKWDGATMTGTLYSPTNATGFATSIARSGSYTSSGNTVNIGWNVATSSQFAPVTVDEVAIFNGALGSATEQALYNVGTRGRP